MKERESERERKDDDDGRRRVFVGWNDDDEGMLGTGFRFAGQIGTLGKVESASIRSTAA